MNTINRKINIWLRGKMKLCVAMNDNERNRQFFFSFYGINPKSKAEVENLFRLRVMQVKYCK